MCLLSLAALMFLSGPVNAGALERLFAPKPELWSFWVDHNPTSTIDVDHSVWDQFLAHYVHAGDDGIHRVRYAGVTPAGRGALGRYISELQQVPVRQLHRDEQLAFWINLYNAVTVDIVLQYYPVQSIRDIDISPGLFAQGPWGKKLLVIEGQRLSLNDIEHAILRPIWRDPRVHYGLNCASLGCPNLQQRAFTAEDASELLDAAARDYVNHPRGVRVNAGELHVSSIYSWFRQDFGGSDAAVIAHLKVYALPALAEALRGFDNIADDDYDWALNAQMASVRGAVSDETGESN
ncbi:MAG: hypothetical protein AMJ69_10675 [Gammaproteobacteria bacterium SG8_47]|nr:MAG: hypothetical protein AMJ69_10675 [Gammaproteobacteria bacterium SG8_47]